MLFEFSFVYSDEVEILSIKYLSLGAWVDPVTIIARNDPNFTPRRELMRFQSNAGQKCLKMHTITLDTIT